jgi:hypothetical protein
MDEIIKARKELSKQLNAFSLPEQRREAEKIAGYIDCLNKAEFIIKTTLKH